LDYFVDDFLTYAEGFLADCLYCGAVCEESDVFENDALSGFEGLDHGVCVVLLHAYDLDVGCYSLDVHACSCY
jgi:hypothetical protein